MKTYSVIDNATGDTYYDLGVDDVADRLRSIIDVDEVAWIDDDGNDHMFGEAIDDLDSALASGAPIDDFEALMNVIIMPTVYRLRWSGVESELGPDEDLSPTGRSQAVVFLERHTPGDEWEKMDARLAVFASKDDVESERPYVRAENAILRDNDLKREGIEVVTPW